MFIRQLTTKARETIGTGINAAKRGLGVRQTFNVRGSCLEHHLDAFLAIESSVDKFSHLCSAFLEVAELVEEGVVQMADHVLDSCNRFQNDQEFILGDTGAMEIDALEMGCMRLKSRVKLGYNSNGEEKEDTLASDKSHELQPLQQASKLKLCQLLSNAKERVARLRSALERREELEGQINSQSTLVLKLQRDAECDKLILLSSEHELKELRRVFQELESQLEDELKVFNNARVEIISDLFEAYKRCQAETLVSLAAEIVGSGFEVENEKVFRMVQSKYYIDTSDDVSLSTSNNQNPAQVESNAEFLYSQQNVERVNPIPTEPPQVPQMRSTTQPSPLSTTIASGPRFDHQQHNSTSFQPQISLQSTCAPNFTSSKRRSGRRHSQLSLPNEQPEIVSKASGYHSSTDGASNLRAQQVNTRSNGKASIQNVKRNAGYETDSSVRRRSSAGGRQTMKGIASRDKVALIVKNYRKRQGKPIFDRPADFHETEFEETVRKLQSTHANGCFRPFAVAVRELAKGVVQARGDLHAPKRRTDSLTINEAATRIQKFFVVNKAQQMALCLAKSRIVKCVDQTTGYSYYYNHNTKTSCWVRPWVVGKCHKFEPFELDIVQQTKLDKPH